MKVIIATQNKNKLIEFNAILERFDMDVISRDDAGLPRDDVPENGSTFEENSLIKASAIREMIEQGNYSDLMDCPIIADDSGLMVDALDGEPGVYSSRYAGENCTFYDNNSKLLKALDGIPIDKRTATFVTVITMLFPDGGRIIAIGKCHGKIAESLKGEKGFGYDPLFIPDGYDETFAELGPEVKNKISHRARALAELENMLEKK